MCNACALNSQLIIIVICDDQCSAINLIQALPNQPWACFQGIIYILKLSVPCVNASTEIGNKKFRLVWELIEPMTSTCAVLSQLTYCIQITSLNCWELVILTRKWLSAISELWLWGGFHSFTWPLDPSIIVKYFVNLLTVNCIEGENFTTVQ